MIKKYTSIVFLIFIAAGCAKKINKIIKSNTFDTPTIKNTAKKSQNVDDLVDAIYGKNGANLDLNQIFFIQDLITSILDLSEKEQKQVAAATIQLLQKNIESYSKLQQLANTYIINYLKNISDVKFNKKNLSQRAIETAHKIIKYINIEQENIFNNKKSKHLFFTIISRKTKYASNHLSSNCQCLPALINFWATPLGQQILINYDPCDPAKIQWIGEIVMDMSVMLLTMQGASLANQHIAAQGELLSQKINKNSQSIQTNLQSFQKKAQKDQQTKMESMMTVFSHAQNDIQAKTQQASTILNLELDHLYKNISISAPQQNYIFNQIQFDQLFTLGTMLTPKGSLWKNPFSVGDWEYEANSNSFWQYQSSPIFNLIANDSGKTTSSSLQAENNSIFTEYFTNSSNYTIAGSITFHHVDYPFFVGIIFNKARWISGSFESIRKSRMIGVYGASVDDIGIYFAEQYTTTEEQLNNSKGDDPIQTPLQQIINNKVNKKIKLPNDIFTNLENAPLVLNFEITTSPTKATLTLFHDHNKFTPITIENLNPAFYMYHGIGFICPGAIAQFNLLQPQDLVFTPQAISNYEKDFDSDKNQKGLRL